jgi:GNAT superfamily N-acetyltransferase
LALFRSPAPTYNNNRVSEWLLQETNVEATEEIIPVSMTLASLEGIPKHALPPGFSFRMYHPGDDKTCTDIWLRSEKYSKITPETFAREFGWDAVELGRRMLFLLDAGGSPIGTSTAWLADQAHGPYCGRIHWVAIVPEAQGRGLSRPLLAASLETMRQLGYRSSVLGTQTPRTAALKLYLEFGFVPEIRSDKEREGWRGVRRRIAPSVLDRIEI